MSTIAALVSDTKQALSAGSELRIGGGGRLAEVLTALEIARGLSTMADIADPIDTPEGLSVRLEILFTAAAKAADLTDSLVDDSWIAKLRAELTAPGVVAFAAYLIRRAKRSA